MKNTNLIPATANDIQEMVGSLPFTARAYVVNHEAESIGIIGLYRTKVNLVLFCFIKPTIRKKLKRYRRDIIIAYRFIMEIMKLQPMAVYAHADEDFEGSISLLEHIGFTQHKGRIYKWHG